MEIEIDHGHSAPWEPSRLPEKGKGRRTVLAASEEEAQLEKRTPLAAFHALQKSLKLDATKAQAWRDTIRAARR